MYTAIIAKLKAVRLHGNADKLDLATVCGNQIIIGKGHTDGELGVYFDIDGQLLPEFLKTLNLYRKGDLNADITKTGMFDDNGRVRAQNLRGEKSEGFWIPLQTVADAFKMDPAKLENLIEGYEFDSIGTTPICTKYISPRTKVAQAEGNKVKKIENEMFHRHFDTDQYGRNAWKIGNDDTVIITEKLHGTSQRVGNVLVGTKTRFNLWETFLAYLAGGVWMREVPSEEWTDMIGTRRVILKRDEYKDANAFHPVSMREKAAEPFMGNMKKGETFYYEVVGYEGEGGRPIMGSHGNDKLKKALGKEEYKEFTEQFGDTTVFSYGCPEGELDVYVYRITMTNPDGDSVDLNWDAVKTRCSELGVKTVPELYIGTRATMAAAIATQTLTQEEILEQAQANPEEYIRDLSDEFIKLLSEGKTTVGKNLKEGVCLRVEKGLVPLVLKEKNFQFKVLEGIIKDSGVVDAEEAEG